MYRKASGGKRTWLHKSSKVEKAYMHSTAIKPFVERS